MSNQIFKTTVPIHLLYELLDKICSDSEKFYTIDDNVYKKMKYHNLFDEFVSNVKEHYHVSKQFYLTRKLTYNSFTNIVRQICKSVNIKTISSQKYNDSDYTIELYIYHK